jgi:hypothetical protein
MRSSSDAAGLAAGFVVRVESINCEAIQALIHLGVVDADRTPTRHPNRTNTFTKT